MNELTGWKTDHHLAKIKPMEKKKNWSWKVESFWGSRWENTGNWNLWPITWIQKSEQYNESHAFSKYLLPSFYVLIPLP